MDPNNQNPGNYQSNIPPQPASPFVAQPVYGSGNPQPLPEKNNKKLILAVVFLAILLVVVIVAAVLMNVRKQSPQNNPGLSQSYDSPLGLVSGMQTKGIKSGSFKLRASYVGDADFTREGTFVVEDGKIYLQMISDADRVNELMKVLYEKAANQDQQFSPDVHGAAQYFTYDFASIVGYGYLYDANLGSLSGFIPEVETAKSTANKNKRFTLTTACDAALEAVKKQTAMTTTGLHFETQGVGINKKRARISFSTLQAIDTAVQNFFTSCYDLKQDANKLLAAFVDNLKENVTKSPDFTYWQQGGVHHLTISAIKDNVPFGGDLQFELSEFSSKAEEREGAVGSFVERRNQFGLAYSLCKTDPVITNAQNDSYVYIREDPGYAYPNVKDTGYYCTTLDVPSQYSPVTSIDLKTSTGAVVPVTGSQLDGLRGLHDLVYEIEKYNLANKRYPGAIEFRDMASSNMGSLTAVTQAKFADKTLVYSALPAECIGTCSDYTLSFAPAPLIQIQRNAYKP